MNVPIAQHEIDALIVSITRNVFSIMLGVEVRPGTPRTGLANRGPNGGVVSFIGLTGAWTGTGSIYCSSEMACKIGSRLLMTTLDTVDEEVLDAVGEIANMVIGNFKDDAAHILGPLGVSTPTVIHGRNFEARSPSGQFSTVVPFEWEGEVFDVKICLAPLVGIEDWSRPAVIVAQH